MIWIDKMNKNNQIKERWSKNKRILINNAEWFWKIFSYKIFEYKYNLFMRKDKGSKTDKLDVHVCLFSSNSYKRKSNKCKNEWKNLKILFYQVILIYI